MKANKHPFFFTQGQSLVEVVVALVVITIILTGLTKTIINSIKSTDYSRNESYSLHLAQMKMEEIRQRRDSSNWEDFWEIYLPAGATEKTFAKEILNQTGEINPEGIFQREITCFNRSFPEKNKIEVIVKVSWLDSSSEHVSSVSSYFTEIK